MCVWGVWTVTRAVGGRAARRSLETAYKCSSSRGMRNRVLGDDANLEDADASSLSQNDELLGVHERRGEPVHLGKVIQEKIEKGEKFCSYELFPTNKLTAYQRFFNETRTCSPIFYALTWHEETATPEERFPSLKAVENFPQNTMLHLTAKGLTRAEVETILNRALELGIINIFALQGDAGSEHGDFQHASDLVTFIRQRFRQKFCICVAGYPEMHPKSDSKAQDLLYLKTKVDAGADFIITQFFFESRLYIQFVKDCRVLGITVPIIPGIFPFVSSRLLFRMTKVCHASIPPLMRKRLEEMGDDDNAVRNFGVDLSVTLIKDIRESGLFNGYHLYTLNRPFSAVEVYRQLDVNESAIDIMNELKTANSVR